MTLAQLNPFVAPGVGMAAIKLRDKRVVNVITQDGHIRQNQFNKKEDTLFFAIITICLLYTSPSPRDGLLSRMPSSA